MNGLSNGIVCKKKTEKAKAIHNELEADIVAYNEHWINFHHRQNTIHLAEIFIGGETKIWTVEANNIHENVGKTQEGGTALTMFGPMIEHLDLSGIKKDESGLGRWVVMIVKGEGCVTKIMC